MSALLPFALFALGVHLAIRTVAALYRVIDLWYTIGTAYPAVLRGILGWGGATAAIVGLLHSNLRLAFLLGLLSFVGLYVSLYLIRPVLFRRRALPLDQIATDAEPGS